MSFQASRSASVADVADPIVPPRPDYLISERRTYIPRVKKQIKKLPNQSKLKKHSFPQILTPSHPISGLTQGHQRANKTTVRILD
jgi:hypothetical protein